jgi:hypothetical protein
MGGVGRQLVVRGIIDEDEHFVALSGAFAITVLVAALVPMQSRSSNKLQHLAILTRARFED